MTSVLIFSPAEVALDRNDSICSGSKISVLVASEDIHNDNNRENDDDACIQQTMRLTLMTALLRLWCYHQSCTPLILGLKNWPILASLPVENRLSCSWPVLWGGRRIVNISNSGMTGQDRTGRDRTGHDMS
eukprot:15347518-Ditylum_brightwellii.AAC.1